MRYLAKARGACASYVIHPIIYKPKIPWWEWIQEIVDVWDPVRKLRPRIEQKELLGAMGVGPRNEIAGTLGLGAALVAAAAARLSAPERQEEHTKLAASLLPEILGHALQQLGRQLEDADGLRRELEEVIRMHAAEQPATTHTETMEREYQTTQ